MSDYNKAPLSNTELYDKLVSRNLLGAEEDKKAIYNAIIKIGYYRLSAYCLPFLQRTGTVPPAKVFKQGTTIHKILALLEFDSSVRAIALKALERIEIALGASICNHLCRAHGINWYVNADAFENEKARDEVYAKAIKHIGFDHENNCGLPSNPNLYLNHYYTKYKKPKLPPAWMLRECASFGFWSIAFKNLNSAEKTKIANAWSYPNKSKIQPAVFESWLHSLTIFRNRCAHYNRITNLSIPYGPKTPDNPVAAGRFTSSANTLRAFLLVTDIFMLNVDPNFDWKALLRDEFERLSDRVDVAKAADFAPGWKNDIFWQPWRPPASQSSS
ncbi:Abi family protein [Herbaspirillum sp. C7C8]|uniref:Abi family protein n=1 Tax=Herbaspirillum sp. C7C8 TaxID=2736665 RepID=UPI001F51728C|nr:Abi family protein [Herbaspirillum sp. C7C8]MCI1006830.1 Abi family protein [Herbaspirillum sp. C7C8]